MEKGFRVIREGPASFSVEGYFRSGDTERFRSASGFKTEAKARQWVYAHQIADMDQAAEPGAPSD